MSRLTRLLLIAGVASPLVYVVADVVAGNLDPGYSFRSQAVSELFAIGAPTSRFVVACFTVSSLLLVCFAAGVWRTAERRVVRAIAALILANAIDSLVLWNFFPMHMRGDPATFTDTMHGLLAINPFVLVTIVCAAVAFRGWFRWYSHATIGVMVVMAAFAFTSAPQMLAHQPTPWLGITERASQYAHQAWMAVFAVLMRHASIKRRTEVAAFYAARDAAEACRRTIYPVP